MKYKYLNNFRQQFAIYCKEWFYVVMNGKVLFFQGYVLNTNSFVTISSGFLLKQLIMNNYIKNRNYPNYLG